ncbi:unnamed protein product [Anisakis simplex]|uniref:C2 domain-containing protein n=1 Tax=Anisakis simplex TaxID=6269 RepID=A0A0M3K0J2_ANISI|nr:unnamed protein product [Anisakis simplex]
MLNFFIVAAHVFGLGSKLMFLQFDQLKESAVKTEKHVSYNDTFYFTFNVDDRESVVELVDPGMCRSKLRDAFAFHFLAEKLTKNDMKLAGARLSFVSQPYPSNEHTGAREMSIRKAEGAMLFYSAHSISSFQQISELLPVLLVCIEDEAVDDCCETSSTTHSSISEGYESETPHLVRSEGCCRARGPSMEKTRSCHEEGKLSREKGEELAKNISPNCKFLPITLASFHESATLMADMIREIRSKHSKRHSRFSHSIIQRKQKVQASGAPHKRVVNAKSSSLNSTSLQKSAKMKVVSAVCTIS